MDEDIVGNVHPNELPFQLSDFSSSVCDGFSPWLSNVGFSLFALVVVEYLVGSSEVTTRSSLSSSTKTSLGTFEACGNPDCSNTAVGIVEFFKCSSVLSSNSVFNGTFDVNDDFLGGLINFFGSSVSSASLRKPVYFFVDVPNVVNSGTTVDEPVVDEDDDDDDGHDDGDDDDDHDDSHVDGDDDDDHDDDHDDGDDDDK